MLRRVLSLPLSTRILPPDVALFRPASNRPASSREREEGAASRRDGARTAKVARRRREQEFDDLSQGETSAKAPDLESSWKSLLNQADRPFPIEDFLIGPENSLLLPAVAALLRDPEWSIALGEGQDAGAEPFDRGELGVALPEDLRELLYNPLVFFGASGLGKSHLTWGLAARWSAEHPRKRPLVVAAVDFARSYAAAVEADAIQDFRQNFRDLGLLLIEDLQQIETKRPAQLELRRLIDDVLSDGAAVLVTMRRSPIELPGLESGLASRLMQGLTAPLQPPGPETRRLMIERLASLHRLPLAEGALALLAERLEGTLPELNHALLQFAQREQGVARMLESRVAGSNGTEDASRSEDEPLDESRVATFLVQRDKALQPSLKSIASAVSKYFKLRVADLKGKTRRQNVVQARAIAMFLSREMTDESLEKVGKHYGNRDHTTVIHACRKTAGELVDDADTRRAVHELRLQLRPLNGTPS